MSELCQIFADLAILEELDGRRFSKLCRFNERGATDSVPGHHIPNIRNSDGRSYP